MEVDFMFDVCFDIITIDQERGEECALLLSYLPFLDESMFCKCDIRPLNARCTQQSSMSHRNIDSFVRGLHLVA